MNQMKKLVWLSALLLASCSIIGHLESRGGGGGGRGGGGGSHGAAMGSRSMSSGGSRASRGSQVNRGRGRGGSALYGVGVVDGYGYDGEDDIDDTIDLLENYDDEEDN